MLLPIENLAEAMSFLTVYDLGAVLFTSGTFFWLAEEALSKFPLRFFECVTIMPQFGSGGIAVYSEDVNGKYECVSVGGEDSKARLTAMLRNAVVQHLHVYTGYWQRTEDITIRDEIFLKIDCMRLNVESKPDQHTVLAFLERFRNIKKLYVRRVKGDSSAIAAYCAHQGIHLEMCQ
ncbi:hypothetical protein AAVH_35958 [Aphelenchoides avenae]|nr:hypothetical protein AAVH_35958 [Aphelenchus avenae]